MPFMHFRNPENEKQLREIGIWSSRPFCPDAMPRCDGAFAGYDAPLLRLSSMMLAQAQKYSGRRRRIYNHIRR
jgi:hypothetical protein